MNKAKNLAAACVLSTLAGMALPAWGGGPKWQALNKQQQQSLTPLAETWGKFDEAQRSVWLKIAERFPSMQPDEQRRLHKRMSRWAALSPQQRESALRKYQKFKQSPPSKQRELRQQWKYYNQLTPEGKDWIKNNAWLIQQQLQERDSR